MKYNLIFSSSHVSPLFLKQSMNSAAPETWESIISEKIHQICCCTLRNDFVPDYWHLKRCGRRRRSISIKRYASLATMPWSLSMLSFHFFQPSNCTLCSRWWWVFFSTLALLCICTYSYLKVVLGWKKLQQGCAERWLSHGLPFPPPSFLASFASAVMQYMPPALPFQKYLHNIYKIFTKYYNCSNAIHATSSAISKYFHVILKKVQSQRQSTNCLFNFIKEHKPTKSYLPEDDQNYGNQKFLE